MRGGEIGNTMANEGRRSEWNEERRSGDSEGK